MRMRPVVIVIVASTTLACVSHAKGPALPEAARRALFEVYSVEPKDQESFFSSAKVQSFDFNGDDVQDYVVQTEVEGGSDGESTCTNEVIGSTATSFEESY